MVGRAGRRQVPTSGPRPGGWRWSQRPEVTRTGVAVDDEPPGVGGGWWRRGPAPAPRPVPPRRSRASGRGLERRWAGDVLATGRDAVHGEAARALANQDHRRFLLPVRQGSASHRGPWSVRRPNRSFHRPRRMSKYGRTARVGLRTGRKCYWCDGSSLTCGGGALQSPSTATRHTCYDPDSRMSSSHGACRVRNTWWTTCEVFVPLPIEGCGASEAIG